MKGIFTAAAASLALLAGASLADAANAPATPNASTTQTTKAPSYAQPVIADANAMKGADELHHTNLRQQLQDQLAKAGYTDVKITPSSFYIRAKDKKGDPVAMVIGPDTFTEVTEMPQSAANGQTQQHAQNSQTQTPSKDAAKQ